jgi:predicted nucleotidyltransferase
MVNLQSLPNDILSFLNELNETIHPKAIYLFGSFANGTNHKDSDVDVVVVENEIVKKSKRLRQIREKMWGKSKRPYDLLITTPEEIESRKDDRWWVIYTAMHEGIKVFG